MHISNNYSQADYLQLLETVTDHGYQDERMEEGREEQRNLLQSETESGGP